MKKCYKDIQGWFDFEGIYSRIVDNQINHGDTIVEVGSWMGKSSAFMAKKIMESNKTIEFFCVDVWEGSTGDEIVDKIMEQNNWSIYNVFMENMKECGLDSYINAIKGDSVKTASSFKDNYISFCFIDALHTYEAVKNDVKAWLPKVKNGGYIGGHDADRPEVQRALNETVPGWYMESPRSWLFHVKN